MAGYDRFQDQQADQDRLKQMLAQGASLDQALQALAQEKQQQMAPPPPPPPEPGMMDKMQGMMGGLMDQAQPYIDQGKQQFGDMQQQGAGMLDQMPGMDQLQRQIQGQGQQLMDQFTPTEEQRFDMKHAMVPAQQMMEQAQHAMPGLMESAKSAMPDVGGMVDQAKQYGGGLMGQAADLGGEFMDAVKGQPQPDIPSAGGQIVKDLEGMPEGVLNKIGWSRRKLDAIKMAVKMQLNAAGIDESDPNYQMKLQHAYEKELRFNIDNDNEGHILPKNQRRLSQDEMGWE